MTTTLRLSGAALVRARVRLASGDDAPERAVVIKAPTPPPVRPLLTKRARQIAATLKQLVLLFPSAFRPDGHPPVPLKIGIAEDLDAELASTVGRARLDSVLRFYTRRRAYLRALVAGGPRYALDGSIAGYVSEEDQAAARETIARLDALPRPEKTPAARKPRRRAAAAELRATL